MTIRKFQGKTQENAIEKAKEELGESAVIMSVREVKPKGFFKIFQSSTFEVTAAVESHDSLEAVLEKSPVKKMYESINMAADESLHIPVQGSVRENETTRTAVKMTDASSQQMAPQQYASSAGSIEEKLENLHQILEKQFTESARSSAENEKANPEKPFTSDQKKSENLSFIKVLYEVLIENDVNEKYVNQIIDELEKVNWSGNSVDQVLSNVYQKMILKFGLPHTIELGASKPKVVFFIGPTGVGKTTTIAKIASIFKVQKEKKIAFLTADTYRIAAAEQLRTYANILETPMSIIYTPEELNAQIEDLKDYDLILVDTAGFSHKSLEQKEDIKRMITGINPDYDHEVFLVLSATTKYKDLKEITDVYREISEYRLIFTKLDETTSYGNILNIKLYSASEISYITNGQNVPNDIEVFNTQKIVKRLLGGR